MFPLPPGGRRPAPGWQDRCTAGPARLADLWQPGDNIGVGCRASGVVGLDLDGRGDGGYLVGPGPIVDAEPCLIEVDTGIGDLPAWLAGMFSRRPQTR